MNSKDKKTKKTTTPYSDIRQTLKDREKYIKEMYELVLDREPSTRELSYYKYEDIEEDDMLMEILKGDEHKRLVEDAKENKKLHSKVETLENQKERLEKLLEDKAVEYRELGHLLRTKNEEIKNLRDKEKAVYNKTEIESNSADEILNNYSFPREQSYSTPVPTKVSVKQKKDIFDKIREALRIE